MKPEIKKAWIADLRANRDKQGRGFLRKDGRFCCLGRLCELAVKAGILTHRTEGYYAPSIGEENFLLPLEVQKWAGVSGNAGIFRAGRYSLAGENDNGKTFDEIADIIEEHF